MNVREQGAHQLAEENFSTSVDATRSQVVDGLEAYDKITTPDPFDIAVEGRTIPTLVDIESADGTTLCWIATVETVHGVHGRMMAVTWMHAQGVPVTATLTTYRIPDGDVTGAGSSSWTSSGSRC